MTNEPIIITPDFVWPEPDANGNRTLANGAVIEQDARIGQGAVIGQCARVGPNARWIACVGFADGYYKDLCAVGDVAYIGAGCRWFTLGEALRHWGDHEEDRQDTLDLMQAAVAIAKRLGLKLEEA